MARNSGVMVEITDGANKGLYGIYRKNEPKSQKMVFKANGNYEAYKSVIVELYEDAYCTRKVMDGDKHKKVVIQIKFLKTYGYVD